MRSFIVFVFAFITLSASSQSPLLDSLKTALKNHPQNDTIRIFILNELSLRILKNRPDQSIDYAQEALSLAQALKFSIGIGEAKNNLAMYHSMKGNVDIALKDALDAARIGEQNNDRKLLANSYANLGIIYNSQLNYHKVRYYLKLAQQLNLKLNNVLIGSKIYNAMGLMFVNSKVYDSAMFYFKKSLQMMEDGRETYRMPEVINNMGLVCTRQNKDKEAQEYYYKALESAKKNYNIRAEALALFNIGNNILAEKKYAEAEKILSQSLAKSKITGETNVLGANYMALGQLKNETGKFDEAHYYISSFYEMKDSILNVEKVKKIAELEIRYETEKKEHNIQLLERDNEIQLIWKNIFIAALVLLAALSIAIYFFQRYRQRKNHQILTLEIDRLTNQNKELFKKYNSVLFGSNSEPIESVDQKFLKKVIEIVESNLGDRLFGVEQMARELGMSRTNLHRKLKVITGFPPSELIRNIRLKRAAQLLMIQSDSIMQISFTVGFEDQSYFSKSFKKQFGVSPKEYLQSVRQGTN